MKTAIWWIRRDLRLSDNQALSEALHQAEKVIPLFILDPTLQNSLNSGAPRLAFLYEGLRELDTSLRQRGSQLILRKGIPKNELRVLLTESGAEAVFAEEDISPYARRRDKEIDRELPLVLLPGVTVQPVSSLCKQDGTPYTVFTPFSRMWRNQSFPGNPLESPHQLPEVPALTSLDIPTSPQSLPITQFTAGESEGQRRLKTFTNEKIFHYAAERNRMDLEGTSTLSPYLRFGMISARQAAAAAYQAEAQAGNSTQRQGVEAWLNELIWRDFYAAILFNFPFVRENAFRPDFRRISWLQDAGEFTAWKEGRTGYPIVDAGMRQLNATGWMHNRARMITASFLTKDLLINWQEGEQYFMQHLLDGDTASNNGGWQWSAGTGTDAAPYFRVFNPVLQGQKYDPLGNYVRDWIPELANVPDRYIHTPWLMPPDVQQSSRCIIGKDYPGPIIDHALARQRALDAYRRSINL